jgi:hypothetical protein
MSLAVTEDEKREARRGEFNRVAIVLALRTGLLRKCSAHGEVYDPGQHDYQGACMVANYLVNNGDPLVAAFLGDRSPLTDLLRTICGSYPKACPQCSKVVPS